MLNWLWKKKERPSKDTEDLQRSALQDALLRTGDDCDSLTSAKKITFAFAEFIGGGALLNFWINDERTLPYPKRVIYLAFEKLLSFYLERCRQEPNNSELKELVEWLNGGPRIISYFQAIDPEDEDVVRAANEWKKKSDKQSDYDWSVSRSYMALKIKYDERADREWLGDELFNQIDAHIRAKHSWGA